MTRGTGADSQDSAGDSAASSAGQVNTARIDRFELLRFGLLAFRLGPVLILVALILILSVLSPVFLTTRNAGNVLAQTAVIAILSIGQLMVILTRGIDLSVGSTLALSSVVGAVVFASIPSGPLVVVAILATGAAVGLVNGVVYVWGRLPHPFVITPVSYTHLTLPTKRIV